MSLENLEKQKDLLRDYLREIKHREIKESEIVMSYVHGNDVSIEVHTPGLGGDEYKIGTIELLNFIYNKISIGALLNELDYEKQNMDMS